MTFKNSKKQPSLKPRPKAVGIKEVEAAVAYCAKRVLDLEYAGYAHVKAVSSEDALKADDKHFGGDLINYAYHDLDDKPIIDKDRPYIRGRRLKTFSNWKMKVDYDTSNHLYMPKPRMEGKYKDYTWRDIAADPKVDIWLTEGEPKALALAQRGLAVVAISGVCNYMTKLKEDGEPDPKSDWLREFEWIEWKGRRVRIVPDFDVLHRPELKRHLGKVGKKLRDNGSDVRVVELKPVNGDLKTGVDDYIAAYGYDSTRTEDDEPGPTPPFEDLPKIPISDTRYMDVVEDLTPISFKHTGLEPEWLDEELGPEEWVLDNYIPAEVAVGLLIAEGGAGKTFAALQLAVCITGGIPFCGDIPVTQGRVLFIAAEDRAFRLRRRIHRICKHYMKEMNRKDAKRFHDDVLMNLTIRSTVGSALGLLEMRNGAVVQSAAVIRTMVDVRDQGYCLIIADPLARFHGLEENPTHIGTALIEAFEAIGGAAGCPVLINHHTGKGKNLDVFYAARGSSAIPDGARFGMNLKLLNTEEANDIGVTDPDQILQGVLELIHTKYYAGRQRTKYLARTDNGVLDTVDAAYSVNSRDSILDALRKYLKKHPKITGLTGREIARKEEDKGKHEAIFSAEGPSRKTVKRWLANSITDGTLIEVGWNKNHSSKLYRPAPEVVDENKPKPKKATDDE